MRMTSNIVRFTLFVFIVLGTFQSSADYFLPRRRSLSKTSFYSHFQTGLYYSNANFDSSGNYLFLKDNSAIYFLDYKFLIGYLPGDWVEFQIGLGAQTHYTGNGVEPDEYLLPFDPTDLNFKIGNHITNSIISLFPEFDFIVPITPQIQAIRQIITSDDVFKFNSNLWVELSFADPFIPFGKVGFQYRGGGLSSLFLWQSGISYQSRLLDLGFLVGGFQSVTADVDQHQPNNKHQYLDRYNAGSYRFYSVNPVVIGFSLWGLVSTGRNSQLFVNVMSDLVGINYSKGFGINLGFEYSFKKLKKRKKYKKSIRRFRNRQDRGPIFNNQSDRDLLREIENLQ